MLDNGNYALSFDETGPLYEGRKR